MHTRRLILQLPLAGAAAAVFGVRAQTPPATVVVWSGFPPGGLGDQVTRPLLGVMKGKFPSTLVYDTKPGAGGRIAADFVKRAAHDGSTILQVPASIMTVYPHTYGKKLVYDPAADFVPVAPLAQYTLSMTVGPGTPESVKTVADFVAWAKANPALANYGIPAPGSAPHFVGMMFERAAGVTMKSIPYKGGAPLLQDLMGGQVPVAFNVVSEITPHVRSGKLRSLAVASPQRWPALPEAPTFVELGFKDLIVVEFLGWYAPAKTPADFVARLNAAVQEAQLSPEMQEVYTRHGLLVLREAPADFALRVKEDTVRWGRIVRSTGFTPED